MAAMKSRMGASVPDGQLQKPAGLSDAEWNALTPNGKRLILQGKAPSPGGRFKDRMFDADGVDDVVVMLGPLAQRFPKVRPAFEAAKRAQQAWNEAERLISQTVAWD